MNALWTIPLLLKNTIIIDLMLLLTWSGFFGHGNDGFFLLDECCFVVLINPTFVTRYKLGSLGLFWPVLKAHCRHPCGAASGYHSTILGWIWLSSSSIHWAESTDKWHVSGPWSHKHYGLIACGLPGWPPHFCDVLFQHCAGGWAPRMIVTLSWCLAIFKTLAYMFGLKHFHHSLSKSETKHDEHMLLLHIIHFHTHKNCRTPNTMLCKLPEQNNAVPLILMPSDRLVHKGYMEHWSTF